MLDVLVYLIKEWPKFLTVFVVVGLVIIIVVVAILNVLMTQESIFFLQTVIAGAQVYVPGSLCLIPHIGPHTV